MSNPPDFIPSPPPTLREGRIQMRSRFSQFAERSLRPGARTNALAVSLVLGVESAGIAIPDPLTRAAVLLAGLVAVYVLGLYQPPPR